jgi:hypothetical protein
MQGKIIFDGNEENEEVYFKSIFIIHGGKVFFYGVHVMSEKRSGSTLTTLII